MFAWFCEIAEKNQAVGDLSSEALPGNIPASGAVMQTAVVVVLLSNRWIQDLQLASLELQKSLHHIIPPSLALPARPDVTPRCRQ